MEVHITNLDSKTTYAELHDSLKPKLQQFGISVYDVRKPKGKTFANLTIGDFTKASRFLQYAISRPSSVLTTTSGRSVRIRRSNKPADGQLLRVLQKEEKDLNSTKSYRKLANAQGRPQERKQHDLQISSVELGYWETPQAGKKNFIPYYQLHTSGRLTYNQGEFVLRLNSIPPREIIFSIYNINAVSISTVQKNQTVVITSYIAPRIFERPVDDPMGELTILMDMLGRQTKTSVSYRDTILPDASQLTVGSCLSYRFTVQIASLNQLAIRLQSMTSSLPPIVTMMPSLRWPLRDLQQQLQQLRTHFPASRCSFQWRFQAQALCLNGLMAPADITKLIPTMNTIRDHLGEIVLNKTLQRLILHLRYVDVHKHNTDASIEYMVQQADLFHDSDNIVSSKIRRDEVPIHQVMITPTGTYLDGPCDTAANRILRKYRQNSDCFLRVSFCDEDEGRIQFERDCSNDRVFHGRFLQVLQCGIDIAGDHFDFLGFSHSSLRAQSCWFMRPFIHEGSLMYAKKLIEELGTFSHIRCPAKVAARIGQAFSETTAVVHINPDTVEACRDIERGSHVFTDGCGTMSRATWKLLRKVSSSKVQPTLYQIRYKGAKGMLSLDSRLQGHQVRLRASMIKFIGSPSNDLEICGHNARPLPFKLNRPIIKILEDLGVKASVFKDLQMNAIEALRSSAKSSESAIDFLKTNLTDSSTSLPSLLRALRDIGEYELEVDIGEDSFLREIIGALLQIQLRDIKYRSRILVPEAKTLYGICDETGLLQEGQVYVTFLSEETSTHLILKGRVAVTRSPALHPGDVQLATCVKPPQGSPLLDLHNCIVFSSQGTRDLPSMLSGGDLDGDLYNVIYDPGLLPLRSHPPAPYTPAKAMDIDRAVTSDDICKFFVDFMQNDQLGRIARLHQICTDVLPSGTLADDCLKLADLHSTAVDFSKTGISVDVKQIPRAPHYRPDFMAPSASVKVEKGIKRPEDMMKNDESEGPQRYRYYESNKILGQLYRAVDEDVFFEELEDDNSSMFSFEATDNVLPAISRYVQSKMQGYAWKDYLTMAQEARDYYESTMLEIMSQYGIARHHYVTEKEVFIGTILGRSGAGSKYQRDQSDLMKSHFNREVRELREWVETKTGRDEDEFLCLATACLHLAVEEKSRVDAGKMDDLKSFGWVAAAWCVLPLAQDAVE